MERLSCADIVGMLSACGRVVAHGIKNWSVVGIETSSHKVSSGDLFVAIPGERFDGNDFAVKAIENGATAALVSRDCGARPAIEVEDTRAALMCLAGAYRARFSPLVVGITGSVGKTTTKEMTAAILSRKYNTHKTCGNLNNDIGLPQTLLSLTSKHTAAVIEMGMSGFGEIEALSKITRPHIGVITNIGTAHIEFLKTREGIARAKLEILKGMSRGSALITDGDEPLLRGRDETSGYRLYSFALDNREADFVAAGIIQTENQTKFDILHSGKSTPVTLNLPGLHNVKNALAAFAAGILAGVEPEAAAEALGGYAPEGMRQHIYEKRGYTIFEDCYNANPESMRAALDVLRRMDGRRIAVLGDMLELGERSEEYHASLGADVASSADIFIACGEMMKTAAAAAIKAGMKKENVIACSKAEAAEYLDKTLLPGDRVLFKGSRSIKMEEILTALAL